MPISPHRRTVVVGAVTLTLLAAIGGPGIALAEPFDPIAVAVRGSTAVTIGDFSVTPPVIDQDETSVDEIFGADTLPLIASTLTGSGGTAGYSGSASTLVTDSVIGVFATATSAGAQSASISVSGGSGYIDYFTVLLPEGSFVPMLFTLDPSYTINATGAACVTLHASVQVAGGGSEIPTIGGVQYVDSSCNPDALLTSTQLMVPTGVPFRVLYEMSASVFFVGAQPGSGTVDALNSLRLFADPVGSYTYQTVSGNTFSSTATPVPEPATVLLIGTGLAGLEYRRRRVR